MNNCHSIFNLRALRVHILSFKSNFRPWRTTLLSFFSCFEFYKWSYDSNFYVKYCVERKVCMDHAHFSLYTMSNLINCKIVFRLPPCFPHSCNYLNIIHMRTSNFMTKTVMMGVARENVESDQLLKEQT